MANWTAALGNAIRERQLAANVGSPHPIDTVIPEADARSFINAIAANFVNGVWAGGSTAPVMLDSSHATGVTDEDTMWGKVRQMVQTVLDMEEADVTETAGAQYSAHGGGVDEAAAKADCEANWAQGANSTYIWELASTGTDPIGADLARGACAISIAGMDTSLSKVAALYDKLATLSPGEATGVQNSGLDVADLVEGNYVQLKEVDAGASATADFGTVFGDASVKPNWGGGKYKFEGVGDERFIVLTWAFTDAYPEEPNAGDWSTDDWFAHGYVVISDISNVNYVCIAGADQGTWNITGPPTADLPGSPTYESTYVEADKGVTWGYIPSLARWKAQLDGAPTNTSEKVDAIDMVVCMDAGEATKLVEFGPFDIGTSLMAQASVNCDEVTSVRVKQLNTRSCVVVVGTAPTYDDTLYIGLSIRKRTDV